MDTKNSGTICSFNVGKQRGELGGVRVRFKNRVRVRVRDR